MKLTDSGIYQYHGHILEHCRISVVDRHCISCGDVRGILEMRTGGVAYHILVPLEFMQYLTSHEACEWTLLGIIGARRFAHLVVGTFTATGRFMKQSVVRVVLGSEQERSQLKSSLCESRIIDLA